METTYYPPGDAENEMKPTSLTGYQLTGQQPHLPSQIIFGQQTSVTERPEYKSPIQTLLLSSYVDVQEGKLSKS